MYAALSPDARLIFLLLFSDSPAQLSLASSSSHEKKPLKAGTGNSIKHNDAPNFLNEGWEHKKVFLSLNEGVPCHEMFDGVSGNGRKRM